MVNRYFDNSQLAEAIHIASGDTKGVYHINKFGFGGATNTPTTVWDGAGNYDYPTSATVATVTTSSVDSGFNVLLDGLDENYFPIQETVVGTSAGTNSTESFLRLYRATITDDGDSANAEDITITVDGKTAAIITEGEGQTLMATYTVPANKTAYLHNIHVAPTKKDNDTIATLIARPFGQGFNVKGKFASVGDAIHFDYTVPLKFDEKTDIEVRVDNTAASGFVNAIFDIICLDN